MFRPVKEVRNGLAALTIFSVWLQFSRMRLPVNQAATGPHQSSNSTG